jgi:hypothetical protein
MQPFLSILAQPLHFSALRFLLLQGDPLPINNAKLPQSSGFMHVWQNEVERLAVISLEKQPGRGEALNLSRCLCPFRKTGELQPSTPPPRILADRK